MNVTVQTEITKAEIEQTLAHNHTWTQMPKVSPEIAKDPELIKAAVKAWTAEKAVTVNIIAKTLRDTVKDMGHDHMIAVWSTIQRQLADPYSANWHRPCGTKAIWWSMYKKASRKAEQDNKPTQIGRVLDQSFAGEMLRAVKKDMREKAS